MNSCCAVPVETIARNEHLTNGECCLITDVSEAPVTANCPVSGTTSRKVQRRTVESLLKKDVHLLLEPVQYYYCPDKSCSVVYFSNQPVRYFSIGELVVRVFDKEEAQEVPVCYCFEWTRKKIADQISETGKSTAAMEIAQKVKAGLCACDVKNPKGRCCLADVNYFVKQVQKVV